MDKPKDIDKDMVKDMVEDMVKDIKKGIVRGTGFCLLFLSFVLFIVFTAACRTGTSTKLKTGSSGAGSKKKATTTPKKSSSQGSSENYTEEFSRKSNGTDVGSQKRAEWSEDLSNSARAAQRPSSVGKDAKLDFSKPKDKKSALLQDQFLTRLKSAVKNKNNKEMFAVLDPDYVKTQLKEILKGRVDRFLNELFCGKDGEGKFHCLKWQQIQKVVEIRVGWLGDTAKVMHIVVTNGKVTVTVEFSLVSSQSKKTFPYRLYGAVG